MELSHLYNYDLSQDRSQARPKFNWPALQQRIAFFEKEGVRYLPAGWRRKNPSVKWEQFQTRGPTMEEKATRCYHR